MTLKCVNGTERSVRLRNRVYLFDDIERTIARVCAGQIVSVGGAAFDSQMLKRTRKKRKKNGITVLSCLIRADRGAYVLMSSL